MLHCYMTVIIYSRSRSYGLWSKKTRYKNVMPPCSKWLLQKIKYFQDKLGFIISEEPFNAICHQYIHEHFEKSQHSYWLFVIWASPFVLLKMECEIMSIIMSGYKQTIASFHLHFSQASARAHFEWRMHSRSYLVLSFMSVWNANRCP